MTISHSFFRFREEDTSLERAVYNVSIIISHSNNTFLDLREEDNLSIVNERACPNVSFIQRL